MASLGSNSSRAPSGEAGAPPDGSRVRAVVLAAGRGVRMGGKTPKTLVAIKDRQPLLHYLLSGLKAAGVNDLMVVTGFASGEIEKYVNEHETAMDAAFVFNARYASWGNFHSVRVALDQSPGSDMLVVNCDIIVPPDVFGRVIAGEEDLVLAVEQRTRLDDEDMRVRLDGRRVLGIGKDLVRAHSQGEFCGVSLLRPAAARAYLDVATDLEWEGDTDLYYEDVYARMLRRVDAGWATVAPGEYAEVDEPSDTEGAHAVIERHSQDWEPAHDEARARE